MKSLNQATKYIFLSAVILGAMSCKQQQRLKNEDVKIPDRRDFAEEVQSVVPKEVHNLQEALGLWYGRFEPEPDHQKAIDAANKVDAELNDSFDAEFGFGELVYDRVEDVHKKWFYKDPLYGDYVIRRANAISIIIDEIRHDSVFGRSVCAGNERAVVGVAKSQSDDSISVYLAEPGDDPYDGVFELVLSLKNAQLTGKWTPFNTALSAKNMNLKSAEFKYVPAADEWGIDKDFMEKNVSLDLLTEADVENMSKPRLRILRNLIYARHGYSFKQKDVREFFERFSWYVCMSTDVRNALTKIELKNMALMKRYEAYAEEYYDDFGR